jgi:membrane-associated protein
MGYRRFVLYNIVGGIGWVASMTLCGYWLGQISWIREHFEMVVVAIVLLSVLPIGIGIVKHWLAGKKEGEAEEVLTR